MANLEQIVEQLEALTLPEVAELKKMLEDRWGVTAAAPVMMGAMPLGGGAAPEAVEEQIEFDVVLEEVGAEKIKVIKAVREINPGLGFGTGLHPTTRGTLRLLQNVPAARPQAHLPFTTGGFSIICRCRLFNPYSCIHNCY